MSISILGVLSLIFGLIGFLASYWYVGIIPCIIALILGIIGLTDFLSYKWHSIVGIVLAVLGFVVFSYVLITDIKSNKLIIIYNNNAVATNNVEAINANEKDIEETKAPITSVQVNNTLDGVHVEKGQGKMFISTASGTSENGNIPVIYASSDTALLQIGLRAEGFNGGALSFIYVDGILLEKEQLADSQTTLSLVEEQLAVGVHKVEIVQYTGDDPASEMTTYKTASYEIKAE